MASNEDRQEQAPYKSRQIQLYLSVVETTLERIFNNVPIEEYRRVMENIKFIKQKPHTVYKTYSSLKESIKVDVLNELNEMLQEDGFDDKFCKLNEIISESDRSKSQSPVWRPSGNVNEDMVSHMILIKLKQKSELEFLLSEKKQSILTLKNKLKEIEEEAHKKEKLLLELKDRINMSSMKIEEELDALRTQKM